MNNDDCTALVSEGCGCHWMSVCAVWPSHWKWLSKESNESASHFVLSLNIPPRKLFRWLRRPQLGQLVIGSFIMTTYPLMHHMSGRVFWWNVKLFRWLSPPTAQIWHRLLAFPKTKITFEREVISDCQWDSEKYDGAADGDWENCVRSQSAYFEGDWGVTVLCTMFLVSCLFFNKCLYFS